MPNEPIVTTVAYKGSRSKLSNDYHYCARCGSRVHISEMEWQRGLLLCKKWDCQDYGNDGVPLIDDRESAIGEVAQTFATSQELQPNPKLINPNEGGTGSSDDIIF